MSTFDPRSPEPEDREVDRLLHEFFAGELPERLRQLPDGATHPTVLHSPAGLAPRPAARRAMPIALAVAALLVVGAALVLYRPARPPENNAAQIRPAPQAETPAVAVESPREAPAAAATQPAAAASEPAADESIAENDRGGASDSAAVPIRRGINYSRSDNVASLERRTYATQQGQVEQQTHLRTTNVLFVEPRSGSQIELTLPELEIEVVAVQPEGL